MGSCKCKPQVRYFPATFNDYIQKFNEEDRTPIQNYLDQQQNQQTRNLEIRLLLYKIVFDFCQTSLYENQEYIDEINQWKSNMIQDLSYWKNFSNQDNQVWISFLQNNVQIFINIFSTEIQVEESRVISEEEIYEALQIIKILEQNFLHYFNNGKNIENFFQAEIQKLIN